MERKRIEITTIDEPKPIGDKGTVKYAFKGADNLSYFTFSKTIAAYFQAGKTIEADVETSTRQSNGNTYTDRKIVQVYVDGQPVSQSRAGGGRPGRSPEERSSIEAQVAAKLAVELVVSGKLPESSPIYQKALCWIEDKLGAGPRFLEAMGKEAPKPQRLTASQQAEFKPALNKAVEKIIEEHTEAAITEPQIKALNTIRTKQPDRWTKVVESIKAHEWPAQTVKELTQAQAAELLQELQPQEAKA